MIVTDIKTLRQKSKDFIGTKEELKELIKTLETELEASPMNGVGLSAIQIGIPVRVAIIRSRTLKLDLVNAKITEGSGVIIFKNEGCLSFPNQFVDTLRIENIAIENGNGKSYKLKGFDAVVVQHELDHQYGIVLLDRKYEGSL